MNLKPFVNAILLIMALVAETVFLICFVLLLAAILLGIMSGCQTLQEFFHIFV